MHGRAAVALAYQTVDQAGLAQGLVANVEDVS